MVIEQDRDREAEERHETDGADGVTPLPSGGVRAAGPYGRAVMAPQDVQPVGAGGAEDRHEQEIVRIACRQPGDDRNQDARQNPGDERMRRAEQRLDEFGVDFLIGGELGRFWRRHRGDRVLPAIKPRLPASRLSAPAGSAFAGREPVAPCDADRVPRCARRSPPRVR